jgi:hypothetical protein
MGILQNCLAEGARLDELAWLCLVIVALDIEHRDKKSD